MKNLLFLLIGFLAFSCSTDSKDAVEVFSDSLIESKLTEEEAIVIANHLTNKTITQTEAISEAEALIAFLDQNSLTTRSSSRSISNILVATGDKIQTRSSDSYDSDTLAYIVNFANNMGYALISADRRTETILAMSPDGNIDPNDDDISPGLAVFFANAEDMYEQQILSAENAEAKLLEEALAKMNEDNAVTRATGYTTQLGNWENYSEFAPLVKVNWGQGAPYNDKAPLINGKSAAAGCVATAIAQIMSYHRYPTYYNWAQINKNQYHYKYESTPDPAHPLIASLFRTIGNNVEMNWGLSEDGGSGAQTVNARNHFSKMGYKNIGTMEAYNHDKIINSIVSGTPLIVRGNSKKTTTTSSYTHRHWFLGKKHTHTETNISYSGGHAWVIDGYLSRRRRVNLMSGTEVVHSYYQYEQLVHCNYGWSGSDNGYYNTAAFDTNAGPITRSVEGESYNYQFNLECLYNINPM